MISHSLAALDHELLTYTQHVYSVALAGLKDLDELGMVLRRPTPQWPCVPLEVFKLLHCWGLAVMDETLCSLRACMVSAFHIPYSGYWEVCGGGLQLADPPLTDVNASWHTVCTFAWGLDLPIKGPCVVASC